MLLYIIIYTYVIHACLEKFLLFSSDPYLHGASGDHGSTTNSDHLPPLNGHATGTDLLEVPTIYKAYIPSGNLT